MSKLDELFEILNHNKAMLATSLTIDIDEYIAPAAAELAQLKRRDGELSHVDSVLENRDVLDDIPNRIDKIMKCIHTAKESDQLRAMNNKRKVMELLGYILGEDGDLVDNAQHLRAELDEAKKVISRTADALEELAYGEYNFCPKCGNFQSDEHKDGCKTKLILDSAFDFIKAHPKETK